MRQQEEVKGRILRQRYLIRASSVMSTSDIACQKGGRHFREDIQERKSKELEVDFNLMKNHIVN